MKKTIGRIIEVLGYIAVITTYVLYYLTKKKMGVQRDFVFRNKKWMDVLFTDWAKYIFVALVLLGIIYLVALIVKSISSLNMIQKMDRIVSVFIGILFLTLLMAPSIYRFTGLPMLLVSIVVVFFGRLIRTDNQNNKAIR